MKTQLVSSAKIITWRFKLKVAPEKIVQLDFDKLINKRAFRLREVFERQETNVGTLCTTDSLA